MHGSRRDTAGRSARIARFERMLGLELELPRDLRRIETRVPDSDRELEGRHISGEFSGFHQAGLRCVGWAGKSGADITTNPRGAASTRVKTVRWGPRRAPTARAERSSV